MKALFVETERPEEMGTILREFWAKPSCLLSERRTAQEAILTLDMVGSSGLAKFGNQKAAQIKAELDHIVRPFAETYHSTFLKGVGDAYFITFGKEPEPVLCGVAVLWRLDQANQLAKRPEYEIHLRMGVAFGEVVVDEYGDRQGDAANLSKRYEEMNEQVFVERTENGGITRSEFAALKRDRFLVDRCIRDGLPSRLKKRCRYIGDFKPKGFAMQREVYSVEWRHLRPRGLEAD